MTNQKIQNIFKQIKGDRAIWAIVTLLSIFSFLPVYSAASNLAYHGGNTSTFSFFIKHFMHLFLGFVIMFGIHKVPYKYFRGLSMIMVPIVFVLLLITMLQGTTIDGANASRWIQIPIVNMSFQTSTLAAVVLMAYVARYLSKIKDKDVSFKESLLPLWGPVFLILILILPANFSTTAIIFTMIMMLAFIGGYPIKYLLVIIGTGILSLTLLSVDKLSTTIISPISSLYIWFNTVSVFCNALDSFLFLITTLIIVIYYSNFYTTY